MKGSCLCCGLQRDIAARIVAVTDVVLGASALILMLIHLNRIQNGMEEDFYCTHNYFYPLRYGRYKQRENSSIGEGCTVPNWLPTVILVCAAVQFFMGFVLYIAAVKKNRRGCQIWFITTGATCLFTGLILRIYQIFVISEFSHDLETERSQAEACSSVIVTRQPLEPHQVIMQQLRVPGTQHVAGRNLDNTLYQYHHQQQNNYTISYISSATTGTSSSPLYVPPTPPSYVPAEDEEDPPPYHIAIRCPPAKNY